MRAGSGRFAPGRLRRSARDRDPDGERRRGPAVRWVVLGVAVVVTAVVVAYFTPAFAVRSVRVDGLAAVSEEQVREQLRIPDGLSMLRIDTTAMAARVASIPRVRTARVQRDFPGSVRVTVVERTAVLWFKAGGNPHLMDGEAVAFAVEPPPPGVPELVTPGGSAPEQITRAAVAVLTALPPGLPAQVAKVTGRSASDIQLLLHDGRTVLWGGADQAERKAAVVGPLLTREGTVYDVSSPNLVTVR